MSHEEKQQEAAVNQEVENLEIDETSDLSQEEIDDTDYSVLDRETLVTHLKELNSEGNLFALNAKLTRIKASYGLQFDELKNNALHEFLEAGGEEDSFEYRADDTDRKYQELVSIYSERVRSFFREQEEVKVANLHKKRSIVAQLREIVDGNTTTNAFQEVKQLQETWKNTGPIPNNENKELWASYKALLDRFYNNQSIFFDLLELDRKKNLEAKTSLCVEAETLVEMTSISEALKTLHRLHDEYKHIGPVPKESQEPLWQRFKSASDKVYDKRKELSAEFEKSLVANKEKKNLVIEKVKEFEGFNTDSIKEWNKKTDELVALQNEWKTIGPVPDKDAKEISKEFWGFCKSFFNTKRSFFKELDAQRDQNLKLKTELCEQVEGLKDITQDNFEATADKIKNIQEEWRKIGQVPRKYNDSIYQRFRKACDEFFDQRRAQRKSEEVEFDENLALKEAICAEIAVLGEGEIEAYQAKVDAYNAIGYVPRKAIKRMGKIFEEASKTFIEKQSELDSEEKTKLELTLELSSLKGNPNAKKILTRKKGLIRDKMNSLKDEIQTLKTNIQFFANSKNIEQLKKDVDGKVERMENQIGKLKEQLSILNQF